MNNENRTKASAVFTSNQAIDYKLVVDQTDGDKKRPIAHLWKEHIMEICHLTGNKSLFEKRAHLYLMCGTISYFYI